MDNTKRARLRERFYIREIVELGALHQINGSDFLRKNNDGEKSRNKRRKLKLFSNSILIFLFWDCRELRIAISGSQLADRD
jgi:hypothetical protein